MSDRAHPTNNGANLAHIALAVIIIIALGIALWAASVGHLAIAVLTILGTVVPIGLALPVIPKRISIGTDPTDA